MDLVPKRTNVSTSLVELVCNWECTEERFRGPYRRSSTRGLLQPLLGCGKVTGVREGVPFDMTRLFVSVRGVAACRKEHWKDKKKLRRSKASWRMWRSTDKRTVMSKRTTYGRSEKLSFLYSRCPSRRFRCRTADISESRVLGEKLELVLQERRTQAVGG